jgi:hypothetical protein
VTLADKITALEKTVVDQKILLKVPAEEDDKVITDKDDSTGEKKVVNAFETSFDREMANTFTKTK